MQTTLKIVIALFLLMIAAAIGQNAYMYFNFGGMKGGWLTTTLVALAHLIGIGICVALVFNLKSIKKDN